MYEANYTTSEIKNGGGITISDLEILPDGSGSCIVSSPLPKIHWLYDKSPEGNNPPMPFRTGNKHPNRKPLQKKIEAAARYAIRASTMNGKEMDFSPDAMVRNFVIGMLGYNTPDALSSLDSQYNPAEVPPFFDTAPIQSFIDAFLSALPKTLSYLFFRSSDSSHRGRIYAHCMEFDVIVSGVDRKDAENRLDSLVWRYVQHAFECQVLGAVTPLKAQVKPDKWKMFYDNFIYSATSETTWKFDSGRADELTVSFIKKYAIVI